MPSFFRLSFTVYTGVDNREKLEREITDKGDEFCWENNMKFYIGGEEMRNASGQRGETSNVKMIDSEKEANKTQATKSLVSTYDHTTFFP